jgi:riboflavin kinase
MGAQGRAVQVSTTNLAEKLGVAQQTISRHLIKLERLGLIERHLTARGELVKLTDSGTEELRNVHLGLRSILEAGVPTVISIEGEVFTGLGEGAYYISQKGYREQIIGKLGFDPYLGTLNLKLKSNLDLQARKELDAYPAIELRGFKTGLRTFGPVKCYKALINDKAEGAVVTALRSHYSTSVLEVIAPTDLRDLFKLKDGDKVCVKVFIPSSQQSSA